MADRMRKLGERFETENFAAEISGQNGAWLVIQGASLQLINTAEGHSIRDTYALGTIPNVVAAHAVGRQMYTVVKLSDSPFSQEESRQYQSERQRSER